MTVLRRKRLPDGSLGELEKVFEGFTETEKVEALGTQLAEERIKNLQKDFVISSLGQELSKLKIEVMMLKMGQPTD